jgi:hypothetical protein
MTDETRHDWLRLMRAEYDEAPGLALTRLEACRLWGLDRSVCDSLLDEMESAKFLRRTRDERYVRVDRGR